MLRKRRASPSPGICAALNPPYLGNIRCPGSRTLSGPGLLPADSKQAYNITMSDKALDLTFGFVLHDIARLMRKRFDQRARGLGLTRAQWQVLAHLARHEGINQAGLAEILEIEAITLGRLIDRMAD